MAANKLQGCCDFCQNFEACDGGVCCQHDRGRAVVRINRCGAGDVAGSNGCWINFHGECCRSGFKFKLLPMEDVCRLAGLSSVEELMMELL